MDKMKAVLNTVPEEIDSFIENIFCTNNDHALFSLLNFILKSIFYKTKISNCPKLLSILELVLEFIV